MRTYGESVRGFRKYQWLVWWVIALGLLSTNIRTFWNAMRTYDLTAADFSAFFVAGKLVTAGRTHELYDLSAQAALHLNEHFRQVPLPFNHPPYESLLYAPLSLLPYLTSYTVWDLFGVLLLAWMAWRLRPWLDALPGMSSPLIFVLALVYWPNMMALLQGQDSIVLAALFTEAFVALKLGREGKSGVLLGLGLFKPHLILPLIACFALNRQWKLIKSFTMTAAALVAVSVAMIGTAGVHGYLNLLASLGQMPLAKYTNPGPMPNVRGLLVHLLALSPELMRLAIFIISVMVFFAALRILPGENRGEKFNLFFSCAAAMTYVLGYHSYVHDMAIMFPGLLLAVNATAKQQSPRWKLACAAPIATLFIPSLYLGLYFHQNLSLMCLPTLMLIGLLSFAPVKGSTVSADLETAGTTACQ